MRKIDYTEYYLLKPDSIAEPDNMHAMVRVGCNAHESSHNRSSEMPQELQDFFKSIRSSEARRRAKDRPSLV